MIGANITAAQYDDVKDVKAAYEAAVADLTECEYRRPCSTSSDC